MDAQNFLLCSKDYYSAYLGTSSLLKISLVNKTGL